MTALKLMAVAYGSVLTAVIVWIILVHVTRRPRWQHWTEGYEDRVRRELKARSTDR